MAEIEVYRLYFGSGLHVGMRTAGIESSNHRLPSDTLFAAIVYQLSRRNAVLAEAFVGAFQEAETAGAEPPFLISSTFPFVDSELLYPVPLTSSLMMPATGDSSASDHVKRVKKVKYVSYRIWEELLANTNLADWAEHAIPLQGGQVWCDKPQNSVKRGDIWLTSQRPRVTIDRETQQSNIFHVGLTYFNEGCGLWFGINWHASAQKHILDDLSVYQAVQLAINDLRDTGIGSLRSSGAGAISDISTAVIKLPDAGDQNISLSRIYPTPADIERLVSYRLSPVSGFMQAANGRQYKRRQVAMVDDGAVIKGNQRLGSIVDIRPSDADHPSWRYGLAFPVGVG